MKKHKLILPLALLSAIGLVAGAGHAARWRTCNGSSVKWRGDLDVHRNRCSIGDTGNANAAYWNGVKQWNDLTSEVDQFFVRPASDCRFDTDDGVNEVFRTNRAILDGNNGVTFLSLGLCFIGSNDIDQVDLGVANDLPTTNPSPVSMANEGRGTFAHEFGHFFGFLDENGQHGAMHQTPRPYTGGNQTASVFPTDTLGIQALYGLGSSRPNLLPSAHRVVSSTTSLLETGILNVCRGSSRSIRFYLGNSGSGGSGTYNLRVRLTTSSTGAGGTTVATFTHSLGGFSQGVFNLGFTVPNSLANGTYFIFVDMDQTSSIAEVREGDNSTRSGRRLSVTC
jgi:hypothetical protein